MIVTMAWLLFNWQVIYLAYLSILAVPHRP